MTQQNLSTGTTANDHTGNTLRAAMQAVQANFNELYNLINGLATFPNGITLPSLTVNGTATIQALNTNGVYAIGQFLIFYDGNGGEAFRVDLTGNFLVGVQTADQLFTVAKGISASYLRIRAVPTPTGGSAAVSATGGTVPAGSYYFKIVALDGGGNPTAPSAEFFTSTTGSTSSINVSWNSLSAAASFQVWYGTAAGAENAYFTTTATSLDITALNGTAGTLPAGDATGGILIDGSIATGGFTVATLPTNVPTGSRAYVTDATAPTFLGTLTGGGAVVCPVFYNGSAWVAG